MRIRFSSTRAKGEGFVLLNGHEVGWTSSDIVQTLCEHMCIVEDLPDDCALGLSLKSKVLEDRSPRGASRKRKNLQDV